MCPLSSSLKMCLRSLSSDTIARLPQINRRAVLKPMEISACGLHSREMRVTCMGGNSPFSGGSDQYDCCLVEQCPAHGKACAKCTAHLDKTSRKPVSQGESEMRHGKFGHLEATLEPARVQGGEYSQ